MINFAGKSGNEYETYLYPSVGSAARCLQSRYGQGSRRSRGIYAATSRQRPAIDYNNLGHYAEADSLYRILESDSSRVFSQLMPDIYSGHALLNVTMGHYEEACRLYEQSLSINSRFNHRNHWGAYAYALGQTGRQQRSEAIFRQLSAGGGSNDYSFLTWKSRHAATLADYKQAYELLRQSSKQQEENLRKALHQTVLKSQRDYFEEETLRQTWERTLFRMVCWLLGILFLMVVIWGYSAFRRRRRQSRERESMLLETANVLMAERESLEIIVSFWAFRKMLVK